jgi:hypothetical protein
VFVFSALVSVILCHVFWPSIANSQYERDKRNQDLVHIILFSLGSIFLLISAFLLQWNLLTHGESGAANLSKDALQARTSLFAIYSYVTAAFGGIGLGFVVFSILQPKPQERDLWNLVFIFKGLLFIGVGLLLLMLAKSYSTPAALLEGIGIGLVVLVLLLPSKYFARKIWSVVFLIFGMIFVATGLFAYWILGQYSTLPALFQGIGAGLVLGVLAVGSFELGDLFSGQGFFFSSVNVFATAAVLAVIGFVSYLGIQNPTKLDFNLDKLESLSSHTTQLLKALDKPIEAIVFLYKQEKDLELQFQEFFEKYRDVNRSKFQIRVVDPASQPRIAECYEARRSADNIRSNLNNRVILAQDGECVNKDGTMLFSGKKIVIEQVTEQDVTNKLIRLTRKEQKSVCFLRGRNQPSLESAGPFAFKFFKQILEIKGFTTREINLLALDMVPSDCSILINAAPELATVRSKQEIDSGARLENIEIERIERYLNQGGKMMLFLEPMIQTGLNEMIKQHFGIEWLPGVVIDFYANREEPIAPVGLVDNNHDINKGFGKQVPAFFMWTSAFQQATARPAGVTLSELIKTVEVKFKNPDITMPCCAFYIPDPHSPGFAGLRQRARTWKGDVMLSKIAGGIVQAMIPNVKTGPLTLAVAASKQLQKDKKADQKAAAKESRIVVFGDTAFAGNNLMQAPTNRGIIENSIAWLADEQDLIHIPPKQRKPSQVHLTSTQKNAIQLSTRYGVPVFFVFMILLVIGIRRQR